MCWGGGQGTQNEDIPSREKGMAEQGKDCGKGDWEGWQQSGCNVK